VVEVKTLDSGTEYLRGVVLISRGIYVMARGNSTSMSSDSEDPAAFIEPNCPKLCEIATPLNCLFHSRYHQPWMIVLAMDLLEHHLPTKQASSNLASLLWTNPIT
jgi:hypothetical protein